MNPAWGNSATNVVKIEVSPNTRLYQGFAANQRGKTANGITEGIADLTKDNLIIREITLGDKQ